MAPANLASNPADVYFDLLKNLSPEIKLELISRLSKSMIFQTLKPKKRSLSHLYGAWKDARSAEEIIREIRESRTFTRPEIDL